MSVQDVMTMMQNDTALAHEYAADFIHEKEAEYMQKFANQNPHLQHENLKINKSEIIKTKNHYDDIVNQNSLAHNIQNVADTNIISTVNNKITESQQKTQQDLIDREKNLQTEVETKIQEKGVIEVD